MRFYFLFNKPARQIYGDKDNTIRYNTKQICTEKLTQTDR